MLEQLENVGLTKGESRVYEALVELGVSTIGNISKKSGISSSKIYEVLERLIEKGLAAHSLKSKTKYFKAAPPEMLREYINKKLEKIKEEQILVEELIPQLTEKKELIEESATVLYVGKEGLRAVANEIIAASRQNKRFFVVSSTPYKNEYYNRFWLNWNAEERIPNEIQLKIIFGGRKTPFSKKYEQMDHTAVKYGAVSNSAGFGVIGSKLILFTYSEIPYFFVITNSEVANSFSGLFRVLWASGRSTPKR